MNNDELVARYAAGEPLAELASAAEMSVGGLQRRLRRIGVPRRHPPEPARRLGAEQIAEALTTHGSVAGAARALGVDRAVLGAQAQRHGLRPGARVPADLARRYAEGATVAELAGHYGRSSNTVLLWLEAAGIPRRSRGRRPRDG